VSNAIRYDAFLVHHLAGELNREWAGQSVRAVQFDSSEQRVLMDIGDVRFVWELHATKGSLVRTAPLYPLADSAILPKKARVQSVTALHDERVLTIELTGERKENATYAIVIELLTNQWNAIALDERGKVLRLLKLRETGRTFRRGQNYQPPERAQSEHVAWRSPLNESLSEEQFAQMLAEAPQPALLDEQPYPHHLWRADTRRFDSLMAAFAALAGATSAEAIVRDLERRERAARKKIERLQTELHNAELAERNERASGDLLLAYAATITRGVARVTLPGFEGGEVEIELDPKLSAIENAQAIYEEARKHQRAIQRIPNLIAAAEKERARITALLERARRGELSVVDLKEIAERPAPKPQQPHAERLPYRRYQTSGGLEVRVGRNAKSNDELTLHHSSPRDIWLHARHVGGAHVVLRWQDAEANPPQRDIFEAATLAAVHSGARTSKTVPVDYTRRKYIRKPRRSPPGTVIMERAKTIFVEPSAELEEKLRS
jgi:predicted ribosome quality control (RQC) complex YloA/Tae2 family protein